MLIFELRQASLSDEIRLLFLTRLSDKVPAAAEPLPHRKRLVLQFCSEEEANIEMTEESALKFSKELKAFFCCSESRGV